MKSILPALLLLSPALLLAAIDGTVTNGTNGKPAAGEIVNLIKLGQGMDTAGSTKTDAEGRFSFAVTPEAQTPYLVQAFHEGISYSRMIPPGSPTSGIAVEVFDVAGKVPEAKIAEHIVFLQPEAGQLGVNEIVVFRNLARLTLNDTKNGTFRFWLPPAAGGNVRVTVSAGQSSMPLQRQAEKTNQENIYSVSHPIKPGDTRFNVSYTLPASTAFETRFLHTGTVRLVTPSGVTVAGEGVTHTGTEPQTRAAIYDVKGQKLKVAIEGTAAAATSGGEGSGDDTPGIEQKDPRLYSRKWLIVAMAATILALGFAILYRRDSPAQS